MSKPVAVIMGDTHFTLGTLELATKSVELAISKATELKVPLILNGDTLDGKAIIRGEIMNRLIELFKDRSVEVIINVGNHDLLNEKGYEHSLGFLSPYCTIVSGVLMSTEFSIIAYCSDPEDLKSALKVVHERAPVIIHQGVMGANLGHYIQDKTSLPPEIFKDFRIIASHYHKRQDIKCGPPRKGSRGLFSYIGNPYTLTFGEANDGPKGFGILMDDGMVEFVPTNLRKHVIINSTLDPQGNFYLPCPLPSTNEDLVWLKMSGPKSQLSEIKKQAIIVALGTSNFKLDLIPTDSDTPTHKTDNMTDGEILDALIDALGDSEEHRTNLINMWRDLVK